LLVSYIWILLPVLIAPLILTHFIAGGPVEATAPQPLVYGSLAAITFGGLLIWVSIFIPAPVKGILYGIGFALYALALVHPMKEMFEIVRDGLKKHELA